MRGGRVQTDLVLGDMSQGCHCIPHQLDTVLLWESDYEAEATQQLGTDGPIAGKADQMPTFWAYEV
jgi:hypothetical protein